MPSHNINGNGGGIRVYNEKLVNLFENDTQISTSIFPVLSQPSFLGNKYNIKKLSENITKIGPDIIHVNGYTSLILKDIVSIAKKKDIKIVYTAHWHPFYTMEKSKLKELYFHIFIKPYLNYVDTIITINKEEFQFFQNYHNKVVLVPHWNNDLNINNDPHIKVPNRILFVGTPLWGNKGFEHLFHLPKDKYDIHCVCRNNHLLREDMILHRDITDKEKTLLYRSSSLLVVPSRYEAFSYVALEALSLGTPVLMSERVRIADFLEGVEGYDIFHYGNYDDFSNKIESTMTKSVDVPRILEIFSKEKAKELYTKIYS